jgi:DNA (cytosine-5)-methyltransferase 1
LERTGGFQTVAFCECEPFCQKVLRKHWPDVPIYDDVTELTRDRLQADGISVDVICGGFPCQDISVAGNGAGLAGERSGLWAHQARLIGELRPRYALVENVSALLSRGLDAVLGDLAALGYDAEWHCIPASAVGAPHRRDRIWIVAYANCRRGRTDVAGRHDADWQDAGWAQTDGMPREVCNSSATRNVADANGAGPQGRYGASVPERANQRAFGAGGASMADTDRSCSNRDEKHEVCAGRHTPKLRAVTRQSDEWCSEPHVGRVANGIPDRVHRLKALGNAVVPQIPELIGNAILQAEQAEAA